MTVSQDIRTGRHCAFLLHAHLVSVTKFRHRVFGEEHPVRSEEILRDACTDFEVELVEVNGESNHVHLPVHFPPRVALAKLVNPRKRVSSRRLRQEPPDLVQHYRRAQKPSSASCSAGSAGGAPPDAVKQHIENQNHPPRSP